MSVFALARRSVLAAALALAAGAAFAAAPAPNLTAPEPGDMAMGSAHARVTVIEYASVGCPHCAAWHAAVFPAFKKRFIDTGRVRFVVREMTTGDATVATAGFMLARCAGPHRYFEVTDAVYGHLAEMFQPGKTPAAILGDIAKSVGMSDAAFKACLYDQKGLDALNARVKRHLDVDKIDSTPTF
ncbi:MAG: thioredoxin domain-containing protein, partial [Caulobacteraceae bacterium]